jgi:phage terminase large subunit
MISTITTAENMSQTKAKALVTRKYHNSKTRSPYRNIHKTIQITQVNNISMLKCRARVQNNNN